MDEGSYEARKSARTDRVGVTMRAERRRRWSSEEKLSIVRETLRPGAVAQVVADQHGIGTGLLYTWRKQMLTAAMTGFAAVELVPEPPTPPLLAAPAAAGELARDQGWVLPAASMSRSRWTCPMARGCASATARVRPYCPMCLLL